MRASSRGSNPSRNWATLAISIGRIKEVLYEDLKCSILVLTGEEDIYEYSGVDIPLSGGGKRGIMLLMPERGDYCYVAWAARESAGNASARSPIIVGWVPSAAWMGHEWIPFSPMAVGEGLDTPRDRAVAAGSFDRARAKMRHMGPGEALISSSAGSDLVLDESVTLSNRRGNEIVLRDQDQAMVVRAIQEYRALSGIRSYSGQVSREARLLPSTMWGDGAGWENSPQTNGDGSPRSQFGTSTFPNGFLTPGLMFRRNPGDTQSLFSVARATSISNYLDPFEFLSWGMYTDGSGYRSESTLPGGLSNTVYGGKVLYRVGVNGGNAVANATDPNAPPDNGLTEYRVEVTHTSKGTLPVTEQTDGFDADRLPTSRPTEGNPLGLGDQPFIEWVLGSVVGNDPFTLTGRPLYGLPLKVSDDYVLESAVGSSLVDHAATLMRVQSINGDVQSFTSFTKGGGFRALIGDTTSDSARIKIAGDATIEVVGTLNLVTGGMNFNNGQGTTAIGGSTGSTVIRGGRSAPSGASLNGGSGISANQDPSVLINGDENVTIQAAQTVVVNAPEIDITNAGTINVGAQSVLTLRSGGRISEVCQTRDVIVSGAETTNYGGPSGGNPANGPSRTVVFSATPATGSVGGVTDLYRMVFGDRSEEWVLAGSTTTSLIAGNITYQTQVGFWAAYAGTNQATMDSVSGWSSTVAVGNYSTTIAAGSASITAQTGTIISSVAGPTTIQASTNVRLVSPVGPATGWIMCGSDADPLTGLPFSTFMLPRGQRLDPT